MLNKLKKRAKSANKLIVICFLTAIVLLVSTYAWFIGMRNVNITSFNIEIATSDSLLVSIDGQSWSTDLAINEDFIQEIDYEESNNRWNKLFPLSTVGQIDPLHSRIVLYEQTSFTAAPGGYRLVSRRVDNMGPKEANGYVVFDLYVKNFSGRQYIEELNKLDEEAVYLNFDSEVAISSNGVTGTGIENSIRIAFAQIGRVSGNETDVDVIKGINCRPSANSGVTSICRTDRIWEPNDTKHVQNAINWYSKSCLSRHGSDVTKSTSYSGSCNSLIAGKYYPTYAVASRINSSDNVNIYDGEEYNNYTNTSSNLLQKYPYFTDTMKLMRGTQRVEFMTLAPNSVTKVRIYIYLEGQDVDNYPYAQLKNRIAIRFGFTKERFEPGDIDYEGPQLDLTKPVITINGDNPIKVALGSQYQDLGATALDDVDGNLTSQIYLQSNVDTSKKGTYTVVYSVKDLAGNEAITTRYVIVE